MWMFSCECCGDGATITTNIKIYTSKQIREMQKMTRLVSPPKATYLENSFQSLHIYHPASNPLTWSFTNVCISSTCKPFEWTNVVSSSDKGQVVPKHNEKVGHFEHNKSKETFQCRLQTHYFPIFPTHFSCCFSFIVYYILYFPYTSVLNHVLSDLWGCIVGEWWAIFTVCMFLRCHRAWSSWSQTDVIQYDRVFICRFFKKVFFSRSTSLFCTLHYFQLSLYVL